MSKFNLDSSTDLITGVWLASTSFHYDFSEPKPNEISATTLMKSVRQIVLSTRVPQELVVEDISSLVSRAMGTVIHNDIERVWKDKEVRDKALTELNQPKGMIDSIEVNPEDEDVGVPVYVEQRVGKELNGYYITGKYDFVVDGVVTDVKTTSTYAWTSPSKDKDYILQGSIYRWLNQDKITADHIRINFIFTDWSSGRASRSADYPQKPTMFRDYNLLSVDETEAFLSGKIQAIKQYMDADEDQIPHCTPEELWQEDPVFKYYRDPTKTTRSTKNFDNKQEAMVYMATTGKGDGIILEVPGQAKACLYCTAFPVCSQKDQLIEEGSLTL